MEMGDLNANLNRFKAEELVSAMRMIIVSNDMKTGGAPLVGNEKKAFDHIVGELKKRPIDEVVDIFVEYMEIYS